MNEIVLMALMLIVASPFAFMGLFNLMKKIFEFLAIRRGNVKMLMFTPSKQIRTKFARPQSDFLKYGEKMYKFDPSKLFRWGWGGVPTIAYNEDSIEPLNPLDITSKISSGRLSELLIRWYNLGSIANIKKEKLMTMLLIGVIIANVVLAAVVFVSWQSISVIDSRISGIPDQVISKLPTQTITEPANDMTVLG